MCGFSLNGLLVRCFVPGLNSFPSSPPRLPGRGRDGTLCKTAHALTKDAILLFWTLSLFHKIFRADLPPSENFRVIPLPAHPARSHHRDRQARAARSASCHHRPYPGCLPLPEARLPARRAGRAPAQLALAAPAALLHRRHAERDGDPAACLQRPALHGRPYGPPRGSAAPERRDPGPCPACRPVCLPPAQPPGRVGGTGRRAP